MKHIRRISLFMFIVLVISTLCTYSILPVFAAEDDVTTETDTTVGESGEDGTTDNVSWETKVKRYLSNDYWTPVDKIDDPNMVERISKDGYTLFVNEMTGEVAIREDATGQYLFTNPYDVGTIGASNSTKEKLLSQIIVNYIDNGTSKTFNSFTEAALRNQITVKNIKGGVRIEYSIGREEGRALVPRMISAERFENMFLAVFKSVKADREEFHNNDPALYEEDDLWFECDRFINFFVKKDTKDPSLSTRAIKEMQAKYPIVKQMAIYATSEDIQEKELSFLESCIKKYIPGYSYEDLDTDHSITNYIGNDKPPALFRMALEYTLDENGVKVRLPAKGLRYDATNYTLESISVLPYMGAGSYTNNGYTFLPDGSGALFRFEDFAGKSVTITSKMYGQDYGYYTIGEAHREIMRLPVFGVAESVDKDYQIEVSPAVTDDHGRVIEEAVIEDYNFTEERGFLAIIEAGDAIASLTTEHGGSLHSYCTAYTSFNPRPSDEYDIADAVSSASSSMWTVTSNRKYVGDITLRYIMLSGDEKAEYANDYVGMATAYREYLEKSGTITRLTSETIKEDIPLYIESFGTIETTERFLSVPVTVKKPLTTFENIKTMYDELSEAGVSNVNFKLTGFTNGGMYQTGPVKVNWESAAGGSSGFKDLTKYAAEKDFGVYPNFNFTDVNPLGGGFKKDYLIKTINGRYTHKSSYDSTYQAFMPYGGYVVSAASYDDIFVKFDKSYSKYEWNSISVSTLASDLSTDFDEEDPYNREDSKTFTVQMLQSISEKYPNVMGDGGNLYSVKYLDHIVNLPIDSSRYTLSSDTIPFIGMVYHGYVNIAGSPINQSGDYDYMLLKTIENGATLYYTLSYSNTQLLKESEEYNKYYSVRYEIWFDQLVESYTLLNENMSTLQTETIVDHEFLIGERVPDADEIEADKKAEEDAKAALEAAIAEYEAKLEKAINFAKRKGTYTDTFEAEFKAKYYPVKENVPTDEDEKEEEENTYEYTKYTSDDGSIVRVTYSDGTTFILNYNNFEVVVDLDGKTVNVGAYSFIKQ
ncbi:MAG: hypothetical protein IKT70_07135 [Clostridia bacterium]|nr:hypothetical protein [Clostridia bacterium]